MKNHEKSCKRTSLNGYCQTASRRLTENQENWKVTSERT